MVRKYTIFNGTNLYNEHRYPSCREFSKPVTTEQMITIILWGGLFQWP